MSEFQNRNPEGSNSRSSDRQRAERPWRDSQGTRTERPWRASQGMKTERPWRDKRAAKSGRSWRDSQNTHPERPWRDKKESAEPRSSGGSRGHRSAGNNEGFRDRRGSGRGHDFRNRREDRQGEEARDRHDNRRKDRRQARGERSNYADHQGRPWRDERDSSARRDDAGGPRRRNGGERGPRDERRERAPRGQREDYRRNRQAGRRDSSRRGSRSDRRNSASGHGDRNEQPLSHTDFKQDRENRLKEGREPYVPAEISGQELPKQVRRGLKTLSKEQEERVSRHLVQGMLIEDSDPALSLEHFKWAARFGARAAAVREFYGIRLYGAGHYKEAIRELRAAMRLNGLVDMLPIIADCERGLGRPQRALDIAAQPEAAELTETETIELMIVVAGAYADMGDTDLALASLDIPALRQKVNGRWQVRLWVAYADLLERAGRTEEAHKWLTLAADADADEITDAGERLGRAPRTVEPAVFETDEQIGVMDILDDYLEEEAARRAEEEEAARRVEQQAAQETPDSAEQQAAEGGSDAAEALDAETDAETDAADDAEEGESR